MNQFANPYLNPYGFGQQFTAPTAPQPAQQVVKVNGENGAKSYQMGANSSALLLDESGLMVWLVTSDGAGYKTVSPYDITPHKAEPAPEITSLEARVKKLEEMIGGIRDGITGHPEAVREYTIKHNDRQSQTNDGHGAYVRKPTRDVEPTYYDESTDETGHGYRPAARRGSEESVL